MATTVKTTTSPAIPVAKEEPKGYKKLPLDDKGNLLKNEFRLKSPRNLVIVKYPKSGSTLSLCDVPKVLIADAENGTDDFKPNNFSKLDIYEGEEEFVSTKNYGYIPAGIFQTVDELKRANRMTEFFKLYARLDEHLPTKDKEKVYNDIIAFINSMKFPIVAIDTITSILNLSNDAALFEYNRLLVPDKRKGNIKKIDEWGGTYKIRNKFAEIKSFIENNASPFIQWHGHVGERKKILKKSEEDITALDIALDGLMSTTFTAKAQAVSAFYRNSEGCWLDFQKKEETALGTRSPHLSNKLIKIADVLDEDADVSVDRPKTYWDIIYPEIQFK